MRRCHGHSSEAGTIGARRVLVLRQLEQRAAGLGEFVDRVDEPVPVLFVEGDGQCKHTALGVMAGSALMTLPTLLLFLALQTRMASGLAAGAVKQ
jgi:hypothetical protein